MAYVPWNFVWYDVSGNGFALQKPPVYTVIYRSLTGAYAPNIVPVVEYLPLTPGNYVKYLNTDVTEVDLILLVRGVNAEDLWNNMQGLNYIFTPLRAGSTGERASSYLQVTTPNNTTRNLYCFCQSEFSLNPTTYNEQSVQVPLHFYAQDPYWYGIDLQTFSFFPTSTTKTIKWFFGGKKPPAGGILPVQLGKDGDTWSAIFNIPDPSTGVPIVGDVSTYPVWTINGPTGTDITITNTTTRQTFAFSYLDPNDPAHNKSLQYGEYLTIDMKAQTVIKNGNLNLINYVSFNSAFWPLDPGGNTITVEIKSPATKFTQVSMQWYPAYGGII